MRVTVELFHVEHSSRSAEDTTNEKENCRWQINIDHDIDRRDAATIISRGTICWRDPMPNYRGG
jgi:hypothetical protein